MVVEGDSEKSPQKISLIKVVGSINIMVRPDDTFLNCDIRLHINDDPVSKMEVKVDDHLIPELKTKSGYYQKKISGWVVSPKKKTILITIKSTENSKPPGLVTKPIQIKAKVGKMSHISSPLAYARFKIAKIKNILITWEPALPGTDCHIFEYKGPKVEKEVFKEEKIFKDKILVPAKTFKVRTRYGVFVSYKMSGFSFKKKKKNVAPESEVTLNYSVARFFITQ
jgi:hypothetical protein